MTPTAVSIGRDRLSGMAWPSSSAAPAKANRVRVWPSPQVRPCRTMSPTWLRRAAMLDTAAIWSASSACCMPSRKPSPKIPNMRPLLSADTSNTKSKPLSAQRFTRRSPGAPNAELHTGLKIAQPSKQEHAYARPCCPGSHLWENHMTRFGILGAAALVASALASPAMAQEVVYQSRLLRPVLSKRQLPEQGTGQSLPRPRLLPEPGLLPEPEWAGSGLSARPPLARQLQPL